MNVRDIHLTEFALTEALAENVHTNARCPQCDDYVVLFGNRAESLDAEGRNERADAFRFLGLVAFFRLKLDDRDRPLGSCFVTHDTDAWGIDSLSDEQIAVVATVAGTVADPELRHSLRTSSGFASGIIALPKWRLLPIRNPRSGYWQARTTFALLIGSSAPLQLAATLGRQQPLFEQTAAVLEGVSSSPSVKPHNLARCLDVLLKFGIGDPQIFAGVAESRATGDESRNNPLWQRRFWELAAKFYDRAKLSHDAKRARFEVARTFEADAEAALNRTPPSHLVAMRFWKMRSKPIGGFPTPKPIVKECIGRFSNARAGCPVRFLPLSPSLSTLPTSPAGQETWSEASLCQRRFARWHLPSRSRVRQSSVPMPKSRSGTIRWHPSSLSQS